MNNSTSDTENVFAVGSWAFSLEHREAVRIVDSQSVWGHTSYQVWIPSQGTVVWLAGSSLTGLAEPEIKRSLEHVIYKVAASRVIDALAQDVLLAPLEGGVIPLPHQLEALRRAVANDSIRYLFADEVGLGKTIEAGLVVRELKLRGLAHRILVVAPTGLVAQWAQEMKTHFSEQFQILSPSDFSAYRHLAGDDNIWRRFDQVICPVDSVKPVERRRGWTKERLDRHNQERIGDLIAAGWDLIIVDESHRLGGSTDTVARYKLGKALAETAPYLLLLSATPHQGKTESFHRLMALLDQDAFPHIGFIKRENVAPFVIRTEKRRAIDERGDPLFQPRITRLVPVRWLEKHALQKQLYESVTEYVREGYDQAIRQNRQYLGFLMILMQRLVTSSTKAVASALERRQEVLKSTSILPVEEEPEADDLEEQDGQEQLEDLLAARIAGLETEKDEVRLLLELARRCHAQGPDARAETLLDLLYKVQQEENNPDLKFLIFTEFVPTQEMLRSFLEEHGFSVVCLNGSMDLEQRQQVQRQFSKKIRILVSTDAGGEGLNLQFAHVVINYDLPWNPMRIEQRIGRVDRIGQAHLVNAFNLIFEDSVELRVHQVLEEKLQTIHEEFGVDKTSDVLDSAESGAAFERLYAKAILDPDNLEKSVEQLMKEVRQQAEAEREGKSLYEQVPLDPKFAAEVANHPLPYWVEQMTVAYLRAEGGKVQRNLFAYDLEWPDGERAEQVVFHGREAQKRGLTHMNLENPRLRNLIQRLPRAVPGEPISKVTVPNVSAEIHGFWSLWQVVLNAGQHRRVRVLPIFCHDDGRTLLPTARTIWEKLLQEAKATKQVGIVDGPAAEKVFAKMREEAERLGRSLFQELNAKHQERIGREREKGRYAYRVRREALNRIGLPEVREFRLKRLDEEERAWEAELCRQEHILPDLQPVVLIRVEATNG